MRLTMEWTTPRKFMRIADILHGAGYSVGQQLGEGTYSKVRTAERRTDGTMCAVKIVDRHRVRKDYLQKFMPKELEIIAKLNHENIVKIYVIIQTTEFVFQIMEYAEKGDVLKMIQTRGFLQEEQCKIIFQDIINGVKYLHDNCIAHRDLKCENILVFESNKAAVSDFGFSCTFNEHADSFLCRTFCGSTAYASPEVLQGIPYDPRKSDVWSLGIVLFTMLCGMMPFDDGNVTSMVQKQLSRNYNFPKFALDKTSEAVKHLVYSILEPCCKKRPTLEKILSSEWLKE